MISLLDEHCSPYQMKIYDDDIINHIANIMAHELNWDTEQINIENRNV